MSARLRTALRESAIQDWFLLAYHLILLVAALQSDPLPGYSKALREIGLLTLFYVVSLFLIRTRLLPGAMARGILYRIAMVAPIEVSYFFFRNMLPLANPRALDVELHALDLQLFGIEPAVYFERFMSLATVEWFAFFYYGYFFMMLSHVLAIVFFAKRRQPLGEFALGLIITFTTGHLLYFVVPGFGPGVAMPELFEQPLPIGPWMHLVNETVATAGAQKDIFPSIHTAVPTFLTLWCFRHRWTIPYKYSWPAVAFFSLNIIIATMFLRWHYLIDVVVGLCIGSFTLWLGIIGTRFEIRRRTKQNLRPVWPEFDWTNSRNS